MNSQLKRITDMAELLLAKKLEIENLVEALTEAKEELQRLECEDMPELMREAELKSFTMANGDLIELQDEISCAITEANAPRAMAWLDANNFGGLIKTKLQMLFNREDRESAVKLAEQVKSEAGKLGTQVDYQLAESVHSSTLKSFVKEQLAKGNKIPFDLFGIHPYSKVNIKKKKEK